MTASLAIARRTTASSTRLRRVIGFGILELLPALLFLIASAQAPRDEETSIAILFASVFFFPLIAPIVAMIVATGALGAERADQTLSFIALRPISRMGIAVAKLAAAVFAACLINAIGAIGLGVAYALVNGTTNLIVPLVVGAVVTSACYAAVFVPFGFFTSRAVIVGLIFLFVVENGVIAALSGMTWLSLWRIGYSAFAGLLAKPITALGEEADEVVDAALGGVAAGAGGALLKTAVLLGVTALLTTWLLRRRDLT